MSISWIVNALIVILLLSSSRSSSCIDLLLFLRWEFHVNCMDALLYTYVHLFPLRQVRHIVRRPYKDTMLTAARRAARRQWAQARFRWPQHRWWIILFTDESQFRLYTNDGCTRKLRWCCDRCRDPRVFKMNRFGGPHLIVWAGIYANGKAALHFITGHAGNHAGVRCRDESLRPFVLPDQQHHHLGL